jgi:hypothetical protein
MLRVIHAVALCDAAYGAAGSSGTLTGVGQFTFVVRMYSLHACHPPLCMCCPQLRMCNAVGLALRQARYAPTFFHPSLSFLHLLRVRVGYSITCGLADQNATGTCWVLTRSALWIAFELQWPCNQCSCRGAPAIAGPRTSVWAA